MRSSLEHGVCIACFESPPGKGSPECGVETDSGREWAGRLRGMRHWGVPTRQTSPEAGSRRQKLGAQEITSIF